MAPGPEVADHRLLLDAEAGEAQVQVRRALDPVRLDVRGPAYRPGRCLARPGADDQPGAGRPSGAVRPRRPTRRGQLGPEVQGLRLDGDWHVDEDHDTLTVRLPWSTWNKVEHTTRPRAGADVPAEAYADLAP